MSLPRYPEYKDSTVAWLGKLPVHWSCFPARRVFSEKRESAQDGDGQLSATQRYGVIPQRLFMEAEDQKVVLALSGTGNFKHVEKDDFVISLRSFQGGIEWSDYTGCVSPAYTVLRATAEIWPRYWAYALKSSSYISALQTVTAGIRDGKNISYSQFGSLPVPVPMLEEQSAIAAFLDHETAKIDALIAEQEKLLTLLAEKHKATVSHAVTRGLNANAPMKDSGIGWLGEVPTHWEVTQLKHVARPGTAITYGIVQAGPHFEGGVPYIKTSDMAGDSLPLDGYALTSPEIDASYARSKVGAGDLVIAIRATVGKCLSVPPELAGANLTQGTAKIAPGSRVIPAFLLVSLRSYFVQTYFDSMAKGATFKEITLDALRRTPVLVPPKEEQLEIAAFVEGEAGKLGILRVEVERAVALLKERRSALIAAAVTGKIDVRVEVEVAV